MPKVSVIIPNYNHARFLRRRFESVLGQTYQDFEIIYLDDASSDKSNEIAAPFLEGERIRAVYNSLNSGNPFHQWNQGVRTARGEYLWIAESDDFADERFLEKLVPLLDEHPSIGLAYCQSWLVDANDQICGSMREGYLKDVPDPRWETPFINRGIEECRRWLVIKNTIPNASAVLLRRTVYDNAGGADESMRLCGDWSSWVKFLLHSDVAFIPEHLNYFRTHSGTVRHRTVATVLFVEESYRIVREIMRQTQVDFAIRDRIGESLTNAWLDFVDYRQAGHSWATDWRIFWDARVVDPHFFRRLRPRLREFLWNKVKNQLLDGSESTRPRS